MARSAQDLIDRRHLRRKVSFWRIVAVLIAAAAIVAAAFSTFGSETAIGGQIARIEVEGMILENQDLLDLIDELKKDDSVEALVVRVDSPGGTTVGGEALYEALRDVAAIKPVVAEVGTLAASAGYMVAAASDHIVARRTSIVGSVGVIFQYVNATELLDTIGVEVNAIKSSPLKAEPSPFEPTSEEAKAMIRRLVLDTYAWFTGLVAERRDLTPQQVRAVSDGSVFSGRQGLDLKLVDALGGEEAVRRYLSEERGLDLDLPIVDREPNDEVFGLSIFAGAGAFVLERLGLGELARLWGATLAPATQLDGLISLWQPAQGSYGK